MKLRVTKKNTGVAEEDGSVTVEFIGVLILLLTLLLGIVQLSIYLYARGVVINATVEGARRAAEFDEDLSSGIQQSQSVLSGGIGGLANGINISAYEDGRSVVVVADGVIPGLGPIPELPVHASSEAFDEEDAFR